MNKFISIVINADTRSGFTDSETSIGNMFEGCRSIDFLVEGVKNKIKFFEGFEKEVIVFIDEHNRVPEDVINQIREIADSVIIRRHDKRYGDMKNFEKFNDFNYLSALFMAHGEVVAHFDQDCAAFTSNKESVDELINMLNDYKFISYPSHWSPRAVHDPSFGNRTWASTRFFLCKRETIKYDTMISCLMDAEWAYNTFGDSPRRLNWTEHFLTLTNNDSAYYPKIEPEKRHIFCWNHYKAGVLPKLNNMNYEEVKNYISDCGGIVYPADITAKQI